MLGSPVVSLDVDGVLNAYRMAPLQPGWEHFKVELTPENIQDSPFLHGPETITVTLNPTLHGPWITDLRNRAEVVWATTRESAYQGRLFRRRRGGWICGRCPSVRLCTGSAGRSAPHCRLEPLCLAGGESSLASPRHLGPFGAREERMRRRNGKRRRSRK